MEMFPRTVCVDLRQEDITPCDSFAVPPPGFNVTFPEVPTSPLPTTKKTTTIRAGTTTPITRITITTVTASNLPPKTPKITTKTATTPWKSTTIAPYEPNIGLIVGVLCGVLLLLAIIVAYIIWRRKYANGKSASGSTSPDPIMGEDNTSRFSFSGKMQLGLACPCLYSSEKEEVLGEQVYDHKLEKVSSVSAAVDGTDNNKSTQNGGKKHHGDEGDENHEKTLLSDDPNLNEEGGETTHL
ncbi:uncharacterized protein [Amphiura filiformis]|uniref:uncharacterized protein n=1 Tax=Amphiura filiformis TaxID=82378 RepID=UPI003B214770